MVVCFDILLVASEGERVDMPKMSPKCVNKVQNYWNFNTVFCNNRNFVQDILLLHIVD